MSAIPLSREDFAPGGPFSSLCKYVARHWPAGQPISLALAQERTAKAFGYRDLHDAQKSAVATLTGVCPAVADVRNSLRSAFTHNDGVPTEVCRDFVEKLPLGPFAFACHVASVPTPVTVNRQWRFLLRSIVNTKSPMWLRDTPADTLAIILQVPVAVARAIALWQPSELDKDELNIDIVGASEMEGMCEGKPYGVIPMLLGKPGMRVKVRLIGKEACLEPSPNWLRIPGEAPLVVKSSFGAYRNSASYRAPDVTVFANPGFESHSEEWLEDDDGIFPFLRQQLPHVFLGYDVDDAAIDGEFLRAFGFVAGNLDHNPFYAEHEFDGTMIKNYYGSSSWKVTGQVHVPRDEKNRILDLLAYLSDMQVVHTHDPREHVAATKDSMAFGENQVIERADGSHFKGIYLGQRLYCGLEDGAVWFVKGNGEKPHDCLFSVPPATMDEYPGEEAPWIRRAMWVAKVRMTTIDHGLRKFPMLAAEVLNDGYSQVANSPDSLAKGLALMKQMGMDVPEALDSLNLADIVPGKIKPIKQEHKGFFRELNEGYLEQAADMIRSDPSLVFAVNEEGQTALFYACRGGSVELARAFIENKGDPHHRDREHWTALQEAASNDRVEVIEYLCGLGTVDVDLGNTMGWTPLLNAIGRMHRNAAIALIRAGADVNRKAPAGYSARDMLKELGIPQSILKEAKTGKR